MYNHVLTSDQSCGIEAAVLFRTRFCVRVAGVAMFCPRDVGVNTTSGVIVVLVLCASEMMVSGRKAEGGIVRYL